MADATFTFRVDEALKAEFAEIAKAQDRTGAQLLRDYMRSVVRDREEGAAHDAWVRAEITKAIAEADDPSVPRIGHDRIASDWRRQRADLLTRSQSSGK